jgi:hypothetical protein
MKTKVNGTKAAVEAPREKAPKEAARKARTKTGDLR